MARGKYKKTKKKTKIKTEIQPYRFVSCKRLWLMFLTLFFVSTFCTLASISGDSHGNVFRIRETVGWQFMAYHGQKFIQMANSFFNSSESREPKPTSTIEMEPLPVPGNITIKHSLVEPSASLARNIITRYKDYLYFYVNKHNISTMVKARSSRITVVNSAIYVGDNVSVKIDLYNRLGKPLLSGGDFLRIWLIDTKSHSNVAGYVVDHMNGSYTGVVRALWNGRPTVRVSVGHTKEQVALYVKYQHKFGAYKFTNATFYTVNPKVKESTQCCSTYWQIEKRYQGYCNFTEKNFNISFYCGQPTKLGCGDWKQYSWDDKLYLDQRERYIMRIFAHTLISQTHIKVLPHTTKTFVASPSLPCHLLEKQTTWTAHVPVGYRYMGNWRSLQCVNHVPKNRDAYTRCLASRTIIFIGDSTTRQWLAFLIKFLALHVSHSNVTNSDFSGWQKPIYASSEGNEMQMEWTAHEHPFSGSPGSPITNLKSVQHRLDRIGANSTDIVVINWLLHIVRCCDHDAFREHVQKAKVAIVSLLERSPEIQIFIKGTHSHTFVKEYMPLEYIRRFVEQVLYEEFLDLQDKVTYLEGWEITQAMESDNLHPSFAIVDIMVHNLMAFVCKNVDVYR